MLVFVCFKNWCFFKYSAVNKEWETKESCGFTGNAECSAIERLDSGELTEKVAADLGVREVTVGNWRRN